MMFSSLLLPYTTCLLALVTAQQTFWPAAIPIAVRSPYLNSWQRAVNGTPNPIADWTTFWTTDNHVTAIAGLIKVDGITWKFFGGWPGINATILESTTVTPTRTIFVTHAGPVRLNITFLSPVEPDDLIKQSFPFTYMYVDVESTDGSPHAVALYTDISGEWVSFENGSILQWDTLETNEAFYHQLYRQRPQPLTENHEVSEGSTFYYAMSKGLNLQAKTGSDVNLRNEFNETGTLAHVRDTDFRPIGQPQNFPVFAFSVDLGSITRTQSSLVWALGQDQDPAIIYLNTSTIIKSQSPLWKSKYTGPGSVSNAINDFLLDSAAAKDRAIKLDAGIIDAAAKTSPEYVDLVSYVTRQVFASSVITSTANGSAAVGDARAYMKDIPNGRRINPVEKIFAALPIYLYINPSYVGILLEPLLESFGPVNSVSDYAAPDLGSNFPNVTGNFQESNQKLEQSSNMLIIALAHARYSGNGNLLKKYYPQFKKWADYIAQHALYPDSETVDSLKQSNNTNLAIKGIIAIKAMSEISQLFGPPTDSGLYSSQATDWVEKWRTLATVDNHLVMNYNNPQSNGLMYNLYVDKLLKTNLIPEDVYSMQASYYAGLKMPNFGPEYDSSAPGSITKSPWTMFTAAALKNYPVSKTFIDAVHLRANKNSTAGIFPVSYKSDTGEVVDGGNSAAMGAMFSILALDLEAKEIKAQAEDKPSTHPRAGVIAGAVVGSVVGAAALLLAAGLLWRKRRANKEEYMVEPTPNPLLTAPAPPEAHQTMFTDSSPTPASVMQETPPKRSKRAPLVLANQSGPISASPPTTSPTTSSDRNDNLTAVLRNELANLRREVHEIREQRDDPPPHYPYPGSNV